MGQVYISYSQDHKDAARQIRDALETWGHTVWMDDPDELFSQELAERLEKGLREAQIVVALLCPASVKSRTVRREIAIAKTQGKTIIPVLVEPLPNVEESGGKFLDATGSLPNAISQLVKIVDARAGKIPPPAHLPEAEGGPGEKAEDRRLNPLVVLIFVAAIAAILIFSIIALTRSPGKSPDDAEDARMTQAQVTADALGTEMAIYKSTADSQATTIAALEQTQAAIYRPTSTDTPLPRITVETAVSQVPVVTEEPSPTGEFVFAPSDTPTPTASPRVTMSDVTRTQSGNLLLNPGFESFVPYGTSGQVAQEWLPWFIVGAEYQPPPVYRATAPLEERIREGLNGQQVSASFTTFDGGLYQSVPGLKPGAELRFSVYAYVWSSSYEDIDLSEEGSDIVVQVGIDPAGGTDGQSASIVWSNPIALYDSFNEYVISTTASGSTATVFVRASVDFPVANNVVYLDEASLVMIQ